MTTYDHEDLGPVLELARRGDADAFGELANRHRVRLYRHCYRMLGSGAEAEEAVQDTLLRAWQRLDTYDGHGSFPGWMYRIATNMCIDRLRGRKRRLHPVSLGPPAESGSMPQSPDPGIDWVEPVSDQSIGFGGEPEHSALTRERVSLAFVAALQQLSARQRAALLLHDVLDFSHDEVAEVLDTSSSAVNSLLFRAREVISASPMISNADPDDPAVKALLARYMRAWELADVSEFIATVSEDVRLSMPPLTTWYRGVDDVAGFVEAAIFAPSRPHGVRMILGRANGQPAVATYAPGPDGSLMVDGLQVLDISTNRSTIAAITSFRSPDLALICGFAPTVVTSSREW
ncbi:MAG: RNA polymerase subunit sigma-70 [Acidimicrobiia bacterium]|nr:RNA polymerase subunit sigma-70 [Acidimicrobiia bacterium]